MWIGVCKGAGTPVEESDAQAHSAGSLGDIPLVVVACGIAEQSGHMIAPEQPESVIDAIWQVVEAVRR